MKYVDEILREINKLHPALTTYIQAIPFLVYREIERLTGENQHQSGKPTDTGLMLNYHSLA